MKNIQYMHSFFIWIVNANPPENVGFANYLFV